MQKKLVLLCTALVLEVAPIFAQPLVVLPDQVTVNSEGIVVEIEGTSHVVESLVQANDGYMVAIPNPEIWYCRVCKKHVAYPIKNCPRCGNPNPKDHG